MWQGSNDYSAFYKFSLELKITTGGDRVNNKCTFLAVFFPEIEGEFDRCENENFGLQISKMFVQFNKNA